MRGFTYMGVGVTPAVEALLLARMLEPLAEFGQFSAVWFADERGPKVVMLYNHYHKPNISISGFAREGALWCYPDIMYHVFNYPFAQLGCERVTLTISADNKASVQTAKALGFTLEGTLRRAGRNGQDVLIYGLLRDECRWFKLKKAA